VSPSTSRRHLLTIACTVGGAILFAYVVRATGTADIVEGITRVGWGLVTILVLAGLRFAIRAACWRMCMPADTTLSFSQALSAFLAGDAVGNITPLGLLASEPTKVLLTRHHLATGESVASLAVENLIYTVSVAAMIAIGLVVVLVTVPLPFEWQEGIVALIATGILAGAIGLWLLRGTWDSSRGARPRWRERLASVRRAVVGFYEANPRRLRQAFALELSFHALAVLEVFLTLRWLLGDLSPTLAQAVVFEALNRVMTVAFKFVPFRIGVDEALSGAIAPSLALNPAAGVSLAVVRKVRSVFWSLIGLAIVAAHPTTSSPAERTSSLAGRSRQ
jgi:hypothetical protein